jgi:glycerophosphoryl diester phosphodiesterase
MSARALGLPRIIGHRGAAANAPENTLESLREAARLGATWVEFDAKLTSDGVPVLFHDETLERTTGQPGLVRETSLAALQALDAGSWFGPQWRDCRVPTLEQALRLLAELGLHPNIEIKPCPGREHETSYAVIEAVRRAWLPRRAPLLSSFSLESLAAVYDMAPALPRGLLIWEPPPDWAAPARELRCFSVHCAQQYVTEAWAREIKAARYGLAVYTVNEPLVARTLIGWGVDSIITDRVDLIGAALATRGEDGAAVLPAGPASR